MNVRREETHSRFDACVERRLSFDFVIKFARMSADCLIGKRPWMDVP
jgi:hypothetical protein